MLDIDRQTAATRQAGKRAAVLNYAGGRQDRARGGLILPILLLIVLAMVAIGLSPTTAQLCAKLQDFPCGP
jgi:hypothetical protein